jgi:hypothetical protein
MVKALYEQNRELDNRTQLLKEKYTNSDINVIFTVGPESKAKIDWVNKQKKNHTILSWHDEIVAYLKEEGTDEQVASYKKT